MRHAPCGYCPPARKSHFLGNLRRIRKQFPTLNVGADAHIGPPGTTAFAIASRGNRQLDGRTGPSAPTKARLETVRPINFHTSNIHRTPIFPKQLDSMRRPRAFLNRRTNDEWHAEPICLSARKRYFASKRSFLPYLFCQDRKDMAAGGIPRCQSQKQYDLRRDSTAHQNTRNMVSVQYSDSGTKSVRPCLWAARFFGFISLRRIWQAASGANPCRQQSGRR